jgi:heme-degrading monooxygenase HmoA
MIVEHALLHVRPGEEAAFEQAIAQARALIAASPGFLGIAVHPASETPGTYLLLVTWSDIAAHRDGFRRSDRYEAWCTLLHGFYDPMPAVTYFKESIL